MSRKAHTEEDIAQALEDLKALQGKSRNPGCGRCPKCHPGRQWGGDEKCRDRACPCHQRTRSSVRLLTGATDAEMDELGGFSDEANLEMSTA